MKPRRLALRWGSSSVARHSETDTLMERIAVAFVSAIAAVLTLVLYPLALVLLGGGQGGGTEFEFATVYYAAVFSKAGLFIIGGASILGFLAGAERMANVFSFFWGTHAFWSRLGERLDDIQDNHNIGGWVLIILLVILAFVIYDNYA